jgi:hypothetical protein
VIAPVPFLAAAVKSIGTLRPWLAAAARELGKLIDSQHGVPSPVLCETCTIVRPRITSAEAQALIALGDMHKPRQIACRTKGCGGHARPLHELWESP